MILLPLRPASLKHKHKKHKKHKNPQRRRTQRSIDRSEDVFIEYPVFVISVAVLAAVV